MLTKKNIGWFALAVMIAIFGDFSGNSFASGETRELALSKALAQVKLFEGLTNAEMASLKGTATLRRGKAGERIIEQGKTLDKMVITLDGKAEILVNGKLVDTLSGQSLVGEIEFLDMLPACADVVLVNETDLIELDNALLTNLMEKQPQLGYELIRRIARIECQRLRNTNPK